MLSLDEFINKYGESIYDDYSSTIVYACFNNNIEILEWLNNKFTKDDFIYCENELERLLEEGKFMSLQWLYKNYRELFNNNPFAVYLLEKNIIYKLKLLKYYFNENFSTYVGIYIKNYNLEKIMEIFFKLYATINSNIKHIIIQLCNVGDIDLLNFLIDHNHYNNYDFISNYIDNIHIYQKNIISDYICNKMLNFVDLKIN